MSRFALVFSAAALSVSAFAACGGDDESHDPAARGCAADTRKDLYTAGMTKPAGGLAVKLLEATPGPLIKGTNALKLEVRDEAGAPIDNATLKVTPFMPDHGHGSAVPPVVTAAGAGVYDVAKVYLSMAGLWQLKISVERPGAGTQEAVFQFCLDG